MSNPLANHVFDVEAEEEEMYGDPQIVIDPRPTTLGARAFELAQAGDTHRKIILSEREARVGEAVVVHLKIAATG